MDVVKGDLHKDPISAHPETANFWIRLSAVSGQLLDKTVQTSSLFHYPVGRVLHFIHPEYNEDLGQEAADIPPLLTAKC